MKNKFFKRLYTKKETGILIAGIVLQLIFILFVPKYLSIINIQLLLRAIPTLGIVSLGVCVLMIAGEFDLSVGSVFALAPLVAVLLFNNGVNIWVALLVSLAVGAAIGATNGLITVKIGIPSFITTLGTMMIWRGAVLIISNGRTQRFHPSNIYSSIFSGEVGKIPVQFIWLIGFVVLFWVLIEKNRFGNWVFATGGNLSAAEAIGINTQHVKIITFIIAGVLAAFAGTLDVVRINTVFPIQGEGLGLLAIAACVVGGTSLKGGVGSIIATFIGASIIFSIQDMLLLLRVSAYYFAASVGVVIILAVILNQKLGRGKNL